MGGRKHVFLVGPGGVGKTTVGPLLAARLERKFLDLDAVFCETIGNIRSYIKARGYEKYIQTNSALLKRMLMQASEPTVFALSSGFLVTDILPEILGLNNPFGF